MQACFLLRDVEDKIACHSERAERSEESRVTRMINIALTWRFFADAQNDKVCAVLKESMPF